MNHLHRQKARLPPQVGRRWGKRNSFPRQRSVFNRSTTGMRLIHQSSTRGRWDRLLLGVFGGRCWRLGHNRYSSLRDRHPARWRYWNGLSSVACDSVLTCSVVEVGLGITSASVEMAFRGAARLVGGSCLTSSSLCSRTEGISPSSRLICAGTILASSFFKMLNWHRSKHAPQQQVKGTRAKERVGQHLGLQAECEVRWRKRGSRVLSKWGWRCSEWIYTERYALRPSSFSRLFIFSL